MKPTAFEYVRPASLDEALARLAEGDGGAKVLAGGQSLVALMSLRLAFPETLVDLNRLDGLSAIEPREGGVAIGAMTRQRAVERSALVRERVPLLAEALRHVAHFQIRNRGTLGGSIAHADPAAELPAVALALGARMTVVSRARGARTIPADAFFTGYFSTALRDDEILVEVWFPDHGGGWAFHEAARRSGDFALAGAVVLLDGAAPSQEGPAVALLGVADVPVRIAAAERLLASAGTPDEALIGAAAEAVRDEIAPTGDLHGSTEYRTALAVEVTRRALRRAVERSRG